MSTTVLFQLQSCAVLLLMFYGVKCKAQRKKHVKIMSTAMIWDIILILQIELSRSAIKTASDMSGNSTELKVHLFFAVSSVILYLFMVMTGRKVLKGQSKMIPLHKKLGLTTLVMRTLTLVTSFWAATK